MRERKVMKTFRIPADSWWKILAMAAADTTGNTTPSMVVREIFAEYFSTNIKPKPLTKRPPVAK